MPFVRLALARYQPHSITGVELSRVTLADYAQLTPDRSAVITINPGDPRQAQVFIGGVAPNASPPPDLSVDHRAPPREVMSDIGWRALAGEVRWWSPSALDASRAEGSAVVGPHPRSARYRPRTATAS